MRELEKAYLQLRDELLAYILRRVESLATAEDLLQSVFLRALSSHYDLKSPEKVTAWLYVITRNTIIDHYRTRRMLAELPDDLVGSESEDNESLQQLSACLQPLAQELPDKYQEVLLRTDFARETMQKVADDLGVSLSAIKSRACRGRRMLKDKLLACCYIDLSESGTVLDHARKPTKTLACNDCE